METGNDLQLFLAIHEARALTYKQFLGWNALHNPLLFAYVVFGWSKSSCEM